MFNQPFLICLPSESKLKAIQEADKGVFISQETTVSWLDSWAADDEQLTRQT